MSKQLQNQIRWHVATLVALLLAPATAADWLITLDGKLIETDGPWTIEGDLLTYTDLDGEEHTLDVEDVDLEASEETTALRAGESYEPSARAEPQSGEKRPARDPDVEPKVILYMTSLCDGCSQVRKLLDELDVAYVEKDIYTNRKARREYDKKAGHGGGLPVLDVDGSIIYSANPRVIRQRVRALKEREAEARKAAAEESAEGDGA